MNLDNQTDDTTKSTIPGAIRIKERQTISNSGIFVLLGDLHTKVHPFLQYPINGENRFLAGIESAYNVTQEKDLMPYITHIHNTNIYFDTNIIQADDVVEVVAYFRYSALQDALWKDWAEEPLYRHAGQMDRCDFGNHQPPVDWALKGEGITNKQYVVRDRIFFNYAGYTRRQGRFNYDQVDGIPLNKKPQTILSWSPSSPDSVGCFIGDPAAEDVLDADISEHSLAPVPLYITNLKFYLSEDFNEHSEADDFAIILDVSIDGNNRFMRSSPGVEEDGERIIVSHFGDDRLLYGSFSHDNLEGDIIRNRDGLRPVDKLWDLSGIDGIYCLDIPLGLIRANSIQINAWISTDNEDDFRVTPWYISLGGIMQYVY